MIRSAKARKLPVTCGVSINHLTLNENDIGPYRTFFKMRPPLRARRRPRGDGPQASPPATSTSSSRATIRRTPTQAPPLRRGSRRRRRARDAACGGAAAVHTGELTLPTMLRALTINPAKLLGLHSGRLAKGAIADLVLFDPGEPWVVNKDLLRSRSKNTPFDESKMQGRVLRTMVAGETVYQYAGVERT